VIILVRTKSNDKFERYSFGPAIWCNAKLGECDWRGIAGRPPFEGRRANVAFAGAGGHLRGASRTKAARIGRVTLQIVRDRVVKFNAAGPDGLIDRKLLERPSRLNAAHRAALVEAIERGADPCRPWGCTLADHRPDANAVGRFCRDVSRQALRRALRSLGYRKLSARPKHHAQDPEAIEAFRKEALPPSWTRSGPPSRAVRR